MFYIEPQCNDSIKSIIKQIRNNQMSIEQVIASLAESNIALAAAMDRNTAAATALMKARQGSVVNVTNTVESAEEPAKTEKKAPAKTEKKAPAKTEKKAPAKKKAAAKTEPQDDEPEPESDEADAVTMVEVRAAAIAIREEIGTAALQASQKAFKVSSIKELSEDQYAMYVRYCNDKLAENEV